MKSTLIDYNNSSSEAHVDVEHLGNSSPRDRIKNKLLSFKRTGSFSSVPKCADEFTSEETTNDLETDRMQVPDVETTDESELTTNTDNYSFEPPLTHGQDAQGMVDTQYVAKLNSPRQILRVNSPRLKFDERYRKNEKLEDETEISAHRRNKSLPGFLQHFSWRKDSN
ncbi:Clip4 [Acrasis kona]|uniref:Clip4 n=1 Tax=Acrasis kona TaxID=1008807 RepID=A0AAW2Z5J1_9EUKA